MRFPVLQGWMVGDNWILQPHLVLEPTSLSTRHALKALGYVE